MLLLMRWFRNSTVFEPRKLDDSRKPVFQAQSSLTLSLGVSLDTSHGSWLGGRRPQLTLQTG